MIKRVNNTKNILKDNLEFKELSEVHLFTSVCGVTNWTHQSETKDGIILKLIKPSHDKDFNNCSWLLFLEVSWKYMNACSFYLHLIFFYKLKKILNINAYNFNSHVRAEFFDLVMYDVIDTLVTWQMYITSGSIATAAT